MFGEPGEIVTEEHRAKALLQTKDTLQKLDGIRKELGIPPDQLYLVVDMYGGHLTTLVNTDNYERRKIKNKARKARIEAATKAAGQHNFGPGGYQGLPLPSPLSGGGYLSGYNPLFDDDDDE